MAFLKPAGCLATGPNKNLGALSPDPVPARGPLPGPHCAPTAQRCAAGRCAGGPWLRGRATGPREWQAVHGAARGVSLRARNATSPKTLSCWRKKCESRSPGRTPASPVGAAGPREGQVAAPGTRQPTPRPRTHWRMRARLRPRPQPAVLWPRRSTCRFR